MVGCVNQHGHGPAMVNLRHPPRTSLFMGRCLAEAPGALAENRRRRVHMQTTLKSTTT